MFTPSDLAQLAAAAISVAEAERQLVLLRHPPAPIRLLRPATVDDGIARPRTEQIERWVALGLRAREAGRITKFVPASGAATRMFGALAAAREHHARTTPPELRRLAAAGDEEARYAADFLAALPRLALARPLASVLGVSLGDLISRSESEALEEILAPLLDAPGLDASRLPKALLPFHLDGERIVTAFAEQIAEGHGYLTDRGGGARHHFTVQPQARALLEQALAEVRGEMPAGLRLEVTLSEQSAATNTLALDAAGELARTSTGELLLRPSGHGALLPNLEASGADLAIVKNIDNVLPAARHTELASWQLALVGLALEAESGLAPAVEDRDRPLRVCAVVANSGEPGGGPYWVVDERGEASLQLVESSQVDPDSAEQQALLRRATHFNPVDLVCALRDSAGAPYRLERYVDPATAFVTQKLENGRELTVLERPGLWNGAMAGWRTLFVELPGWTFAPVKSVLDLARHGHAVPE